MLQVAIVHSNTNHSSVHFNEHMMSASVAILSEAKCLFSVIKELQNRLRFWIFVFGPEVKLHL